MPTKTDRILSYLPGTFRRAPQLSALFALVDAFGSELLEAENSLAAIMQAHWVDHADRGAEIIDDLARIAALYGLAPRCKVPPSGELGGPETKLCSLPSRCDETVEEFRQHLKRYIRTFLEGTITVQGILRVTAEILGLHIADAYEDMDTWWQRADDELVTAYPRGDDAAGLLFDLEAITARGNSATPAEVKGTVDLSGGIDLAGLTADTAGVVLRLKVDDDNPVDIDLVSGAPDPTAISLDWIVVAINVALAARVARHDGHYLILTSPTSGSDSRLEVQEVAHDAAGRVLGLPPRTYQGREARSAQVTSLVDLANGVDLSTERYLRLTIDETRVAEIDCAGPNPARTTLDQIQTAINDAFDAEIARHDGHFLTLTSPTTGSNSRIAFGRPAAQDATARLFGNVGSFYLGQDDQPARVTGRRDLSGGANLSERADIQLSLDGAPPVTVNCAGADPANTRPGEIVAAINEAFGAALAHHDGRFITLNSPTVGPSGTIAFEAAPTGDATDIIFGILPRTFSGAAETAAQIVGSSDLSAGLNLLARHYLSLAVDGRAPVEIDLRIGAEDPSAVTLNELKDAINNALEPDVATQDGHHLILTSSTQGSASSLVIEPLLTTRRRRFVSRALITGEAAQAIFGFVTRQAQGAPATSAQLIGQADLSRGVDLREGRYLRLAIDGRPAVDIDCAGKRPRATLIDEIVAKINTALGVEIATHNDKNLILTSPSDGAGSRIAIEPSQATDALERLLGVEPGTVRGQDATSVSFTGTVDLSEGIDLPAGAAIKLGFDGAEAVEIILVPPSGGLGGDQGGVIHKTLNQIVITINLALGANLASHDGAHVILTSAKTGTESRLVFRSAGDDDVTEAIFGLKPPRTYQGSAPRPARVVGQPNLRAGVDLSVARFLKFSLDGGPAIEVDCAAQASNPVAATLDKIVAAINAATHLSTASHDGFHLILTSPTSGLSSRLTLENRISAGAREALLGPGPAEILGEAPTPAVIKGEVDLLTPVDLEERSLLRLAVDGGRPIDINVAGAAPATTFLDEIVVAINAVFPGLASATADDHLQLTSPSQGLGSRLALLPLRHLEVIEYPPKSAESAKKMVRHGDRWSVINGGAADVFAEVEFTTTEGVAGLTLVNDTLGWWVRLLTSLAVGQRLRLWRDPGRGLQAVIYSADGQTRPVPGSSIIVGPWGGQAWVPFSGTWSLTGAMDEANPATLQLNNPLAANLVRLRARRLAPPEGGSNIPPSGGSGGPGQAIGVAVRESEIRSVTVGAADGSSQRLVGRIHIDETGPRLVDGNETVVVQLQAGPGVDLAIYSDYVVAVTGPLHAGQPPLLLVQAINRLFDVTLRFDLEGEELVEEDYLGVTIGDDPTTSDSLVWQINAGPQHSQLVVAEPLSKETVLSLPRGRSVWRYLDCRGDRFNQARFNQAHFVGGLCREFAIFNLSRFANTPPEPVVAVFAPVPSGVSASDLSSAGGEGASEPAAGVVFRWTSYQAGAFEVNLPVDLLPRFGGRFNQARFGQAADAPELYRSAVTEPPDDDNYLLAMIEKNDTSLIKAKLADFVPQGWEAVQMPFRKPQFLTLGNDQQPAKLYLSEEGVTGFIELSAREPGSWGNEIAVSVRPAGPAMYDVCILYQGHPFENARQVVLGEPLPALTQELLKPNPIGISQAKSAGVRAEVTRDRAD